MIGDPGRLTRTLVLLFVAGFLWGCEGDDGAAGAQGPQGPAGATGQTGDPGPSGGGVPASSADKINIEVTGFSFDPVSNKPVVDFRLTNDLTQGLFGLDGRVAFVLSQLSPAALGSGESSEWQSYATRESGGIPDAQASTESGGLLEDLGNGDYRYTFSKALSDFPAGPIFDGSKSHRLGIEIRGAGPIEGNGIFNFIPDQLPAEFDPATAFTRDIVDNDTCNACHDVFDFHGGPRVDITYCVLCHNPSSIDGDTGNTVDMKALIHNIHSGRDGYRIIGRNAFVHDYTDVRWTQDPRNCQTCHEETDADTPEASNWRLVANRAACGTCHYDVDGPGDGDDDYAIELGEHASANFANDTQCLDCHGEGATVTNSAGQLVRTDEIHRIRSLEASNDFVFKIEAVRNVVSSGGAPLEIDYSVADASGAFYDIDNDPEFTACGDRTSRLFIDIGWTTDDFTNVGAGTSNAQPLGINALGAGCGGAGTDADGDGIYTAVASSSLPAGLAGSIAVALEGHPGKDLNGDGVVATRSERIAVTNAIAYFGIDGVEKLDRRNAVKIEKCDDCHKQLSMHGSNRTDKPEVCAMCHNPNATDINRRVAGSECVDGRAPGTDGPNDPGVIGLGTDDQPIDFKNMIHGIHSGQIGVCGFGNSSNPFFDVKYPGRLNNCEGCHVENKYYPVEPGTILGTTVDANDPTTPTDDVVISPNTSVCSSCHTSSLAAEHMKQNGGDFEATKAADSTLISASVETCTLCHGPGRTADVKVMHGVGEFDFN